MATRPWSERRALIGSLAVLAAIVTIDVVFPDITLSGSYAVAAVVAAAMTTVRTTAQVALLSLALSVLSGFWNQNFGTLDWTIRVVLTVGLGALAVLSARTRVHREQDLRRMTVIAEAAQRALLRALPSAVGSVGFAARYLSATREALVGGDLYEVAESPYGVRVIVGDVRGKGLEAVQPGRNGPRCLPALGLHPAVAGRHRPRPGRGRDGRRRRGGLRHRRLAEFHEDHTMTLVNCGHHPPVLVTGPQGVALVSTGEPVPPLGLGPVPCPGHVAVARGLTDADLHRRTGRGSGPSRSLLPPGRPRARPRRREPGRRARPTARSPQRPCRTQARRRHGPRPRGARRDVMRRLHGDDRARFFSHERPC